MGLMPYEFMQDPQEPGTQADPGRSVAPPEKKIGADGLEPSEAIPPRGLVPRRWHISVWVGIALLLGAIIAYFLLDYVVE